MRASWLKLAGRADKVPVLTSMLLFILMYEVVYRTKHCMVYLTPENALRLTTPGRMEVRSLRCESSDGGLQWQLWCQIRYRTRAVSPVQAAGQPVGT